MHPNSSRIVGIAFVALTLLVGSCSNDASTDAGGEVACSMLSEESLTDLFGQTNLRSSGSLGTKESRQDGPVQCEVSDRDTGDSLLLITVSDAPDPTDAQRQSATVEEEAAALTSCGRRESLLGGGYACFDDDGLAAASARDERLIRLTMPGTAADSLAAAGIADLIDEIDERASGTP
ncbi:hypothetical protein [Janibacter anophelis]|uniref:hypothetical protein n=1 Tax=Janibacter anophelis TaxID=319054 RepID=UPI000DEFBB6E|nr:hypothetical protein [Janibacter anophelis]